MGWDWAMTAGQTLAWIPVDTCLFVIKALNYFTLFEIQLDQSKCSSDHNLAIDVLVCSTV